MDKVLILGVNGFTGRHFQRYIFKNNLFNEYFFIGADKDIEKIFSIDYRKVNFLERNNLEQLLEELRPDYIVNFAGIINQSNVHELFECNAALPRRILDTVITLEIPVKKILLIGSAAEYGANSDLPIKENSSLFPVSLYGLSKVFQTHYALYYYRNFSINVNIARTFNVIGDGMPGMLSIASFLKQIREVADGGSISVGNIFTKRDFLDISDVVVAYWQVLLSGKSGRIYNVCRGQSDLLSDILNYMIKKSGKKIDVVVNAEYIKKYDILDSYGDNSNLLKDVGWNHKVSVYEAIDKILESEN